MDDYITDLTGFNDFCSNASSDFISCSYWALYMPSYGIVSASFLLFYFLLGLPLNILVGGTMLAKKLYKQPTHILLLSLILSDSILLLTIVPLGIVAGFSGEFLFGSSDQMRCQVCHIGVIFTWFSLTSLYTISLMSLDRLLFIHTPLHYNMRVTPGRTVVVLAFAWLICTIIAILPLFGLGSITFFHVFAICTPDFSADSNYYLGILLVAALVPLLVAIVCNMWVIRIVFKNIKVIYKVRKSLLTMRQRRSHSLSLKKIVRKKRQKKQLNLMRVFGSLLCASLIAWIPVIIVTIVSFIVHFDDIPPEFSLLSYFLLFSQVVVHPALEAAFLSPVKDPIKKIFRRLCLPFKCLANCSCNRNFSVDAENDKPRFCCRCDALYILYAALIPKDMNSDTGTGVLEVNNAAYLPATL